MIIYGVLAFIVAVGVTAATVWFAREDKVLFADNDFSGPQKFHHLPVPRVGGVGVVAGMAVALAVAAMQLPFGTSYLLELTVCSSLAFGAGLLEDVTKKVSARQRLLATLASSALAVWMMGAVIDRTDLPVFDWIVSQPAGAVAMTLLVVAGVSNAINIIDGFNGLASMCVVLMLAGIAWVAFQVNDGLLLLWSIVGVGATLGFFVWNYPAGKIFLGDGGAYFLGFLVAILGVMLIVRHDDVSPLFALLLVTYPTFETMFSIYRRVVLRGRSPGSPDAAHLHTLLYRRVVSCGHTRSDPRISTQRNSLTAPYLWALCAMTVVPACIWWNDSIVLTGFIITFYASYIWLYWRIVRFRTPAWIVRPGRLKRSTGHSAAADL
nr:glycosyltransferase [uncultured Caldimonas sp.]